MKYREIPMAYRRSQTWVGLVLSIGVVLSVLTGISCSRVPENPAWFQSTATGDALKLDQLTAKINQTDSLFDLFKMKYEYILRGGDSQEVMMALDRRRDQLVEETEAFPAIPEKLDFLGWDIEKVDDHRYRISGYFVVRGKMDRDWTFRIMTKVDDQHVPLLPVERQKAKYINWQIFPKTSTWDIGEHKVLSTIMQLEPIPYYIYARMYLYPEYINQADFAYGWFTDPDLEPVPRDRPAPK